MRPFFGRLLLLVGVLYVVLFWLITSGLGALYPERGEELTDHISSLGIVGPFLTGLFFFLIGLVLVEWKKQTVLFLRPFDSFANSAGMRAFRRRLGNTYTVVALDDGKIDAPRAGCREAFIALFIMFPVALSLFFIAAVAMPIGQWRSPDSVVESLGAIFPSMIALLGAFFCFSAMKSTLFAKRGYIEVIDEDSLQSAASQIKRLSTWGLRLFFPRSFIIKTSDGMWQKAVSKAVNLTDHTVIDVSRRSENIDWELELLRQSKVGAYIAMVEETAYDPELEKYLGVPLCVYNSKSAKRGLPRELATRLNKL